MESVIPGELIKALQQTIHVIVFTGARVSDVLPALLNDWR